jgi:bla regulator protein BlaR1
MEALVRAGLANAAVVTVAAVLVALLALLAARVLRRPAVAHALWLVLLLKLLTPPLWDVPVPVLQSGPRALDTEPRAYRANPVPQEPAWDVVSAVPQPVEPARPEPPMTTTSLVRAIRLDPWTVIAAVWLTGSFLGIVIALVRIGRFSRLLRFSTPPPRAVERRAEELAARVGLRRCPHILMIPGEVSPMVWAGFGRARLLIPVALWERLDRRQRDAVLLHELAHVRRRDHWVRWLELAVNVAYWWLPVCWWARHRLREAEEQCCDAWVLWAMPDGLRDYADVLVEAGQFLSRRSRGPAPAPAIASTMGQFADLRRRIVMLKRGNVSRRLGTPAQCAVCACGALLLPLMPKLVQASVADDPVQAILPNTPGQSAGSDSDPSAAPDSPSTIDAAENHLRRLERIERRIEGMLEEVRELRAEVRARKFQPHQ